MTLNDYNFFFTDFYKKVKSGPKWSQKVPPVKKIFVMKQISGFLKIDYVMLEKHVNLIRNKKFSE
jgi:hypothetical protein